MIFFTFSDTVQNDLVGTEVSDPLELSKIYVMTEAKFGFYRKSTMDRAIVKKFAMVSFTAQHVDRNKHAY